MKTVKLFVVSLLVLITVANVYAQTQPSASEIIQSAKSEAAKSNKNIMVIFHASWCGWCHKMDTALNDKTIKSFFDNNYVIAHLTVDESKDKKNLETPGANEVRTKYHGDNQGIPYWFIIDKNGTLLADSRMIDENGKQGNSVGCPAKRDEVDYFIKVIKKTSPLSAKELKLIQERFLKNGA